METGRISTLNIRSLIAIWIQFNSILLYMLLLSLSHSDCLTNNRALVLHLKPNRATAFCLLCTRFDRFDDARRRPLHMGLYTIIMWCVVAFYGQPFFLFFIVRFFVFFVFVCACDSFILSDTWHRFTYVQCRFGGADPTLESEGIVCHVNDSWKRKAIEWIEKCLTIQARFFISNIYIFSVGMANIK